VNPDEILLAARRLRAATKKFNPNQPRDGHGRWRDMVGGGRVPRFDTPSVAQETVAVSGIEMRGNTEVVKAIRVQQLREEEVQLGRGPGLPPLKVEDSSKAPPEDLPSDPVSLLAAMTRRNDVASTDRLATPTMIDAAEAADARMEGLGFRIKGPVSAAGKIERKTADIRKHAGMEQVPIFEYARRMGDFLRYRMVWDDEGMSYDKLLRQQAVLEGAGFRLASPPENHFGPHDPTYTGINTNWLAPDGNVFEIQYHTRASVTAADAEAPLYHEIRSGKLSKRKARTFYERITAIAKSGSAVPDEVFTYGLPYAPRAAALSTASSATLKAWEEAGEVKAGATAPFNYWVMHTIGFPNGYLRAPVDDPILVEFFNPRTGAWEHDLAFLYYIVGGETGVLGVTEEQAVAMIEEQWGGPSGAAKRLRSAAKKYNPAQPRDPGGEGGGQWVSGPTSGGSMKPASWVSNLLVKLDLDDDTRGFIKERGLDLPLRSRKKGEKANEVLDGEKDTKSLYTNEKGEYDPERVAKVHDPAIDLYLRKKKAVNNGKFTEWVPDPDGEYVEPPKDGKKRVMLLSGGNASGKSSALYSPDNTDFLRPDDQAVEINFDLLKEALPEYRAMAAGDDIYATDGTHFESAAMAKRLLDEAIERGTNIVIDASGDSSGQHYQVTIDRLAAEGYEVEILMVDAPLSTAIPSMIHRARKPSATFHRYVPVPVMGQIHQNSVARHLEWRENKNVNRFKVYRRVGDKVTLAAEGGKGKYKAVDADVYGQIEAKAKEPWR